MPCLLLAAKLATLGAKYDPRDCEIYFCPCRSAMKAEALRAWGNQIALVERGPAPHGDSMTHRPSPNILWQLNYLPCMAASHTQQRRLGIPDERPPRAKTSAPNLKHWKGTNKVL